VGGGIDSPFIWDACGLTAGGVGAGTEVGAVVCMVMLALGG
jgi:hypothetical protein